MIILAVDLGDARTGLAVSDSMEILASPVGVVQEKDFDTIVEKVAETATQRRAEKIVVGHPKNMDGTTGERAEKSQLFAHELGKKVSVPVVLWDERSTTISAHGYLNRTNTRGKKRKNVIDAVAATIILESYLAWRRNHRKVDEE